MKTKKMYLFGCIEKNIGDDLFIYIVCQRYPDVEFIISEDAKYLSINNIPNLEYSKILKKWLKYANSESNNIIKKMIIYFMERFYRIFLKKYDSIYIVGNAFKNLNYKGSYQLDWLYRRISISNNFYLLSTNYGPTNNDNWQIDCHKIFSKITDVCFRDINSYNTFSDLKNVRYAPDAVLSIGSYFMDRKKVKDQEYVIISVIDCLLEQRNSELKKAVYEYENKMISLINGFNSDGVKVVILNSNTIQDSPAAIRIYNECINKSMVSIFNYDGNIEKVLELFSSSKAVIATRLHTIILSWIYDIPVIPIIYDIKVDNLLKSYKFDEFNTQITDLTDFNYKLVCEKIFKYSYKISKSIVDDSNNQFKAIDTLLKGK